jgi:hypothetical protein
MMGKTTPELTVELITAITAALSIVRDLTPMHVDDDGPHRMAETNLVKALSSIAESLLPRSESNVSPVADATP